MTSALDFPVPAMDLQGYRALVCGSTQGIGKACAVHLAQRGASITLAARNETTLKDLAEKLPKPRAQQHHFIQADFHDFETLAERARYCLEEWGEHLILVNNTGGPPAGTALEAQPEDFLRAIRAHLVANQVLTQALVPGMKSAEFGRIVNVISTSVREPIPGLGVSNTARGAVASWAKTLSRELGPFGITVNSILPGYTDTARLRQLIDRWAERDGVAASEVVQRMKGVVPAHRFAEPAEIAAAVGFLASPAASYVNGVCLPVDGGRLTSI